MIRKEDVHFTKTLNPFDIGAMDHTARSQLVASVTVPQESSADVERRLIRELEYILFGRISNKVHDLVIAAYRMARNAAGSVPNADSEFKQKCDELADLLKIGRGRAADANPDS